MNHLLLTLFSLLTIAGCGGGDTQGTEISAPEVVDVAQVANDQVVAIEVKGIDERNRGDKQGPIHLHGNVHVSMKGSKMYLYESEGKTTSKIDSLKVVDATYDFGTKTYSRGFYFIGNGDPNNMTPIILNPDESDVQIDFK